jgi:F0F1-type ATP synthase membrane subunit b/b'
MSQLNLKPDPVIIGIQAVIFLVNIGIIKKLFLEPYLALKDARDAATIGGQSQADQMLADSKRMQEQIDQRVRETFQRVSKTSEAVRVEAATKKQQLIADAEKHARDLQNAALAEIDAELKTARASIEKEIDQVASAMMTAVLA